MRKSVFTAAIVATLGLVAATPDPVHPGKANWDKHCTKCHGAEGKGNPKIAAVLKLDPALLDLTKASTVAKSDTDLVKFIEDGKDKMPAFKKDDKLCCWEMSQLISYLRAHQPVPPVKKPVPPAAPAK